VAGGDGELQAEQAISAASATEPNSFFVVRRVTVIGNGILIVNPVVLVHRAW
jgi:hypothetical protein